MMAASPQASPYDSHRLHPTHLLPTWLMVLFGRTPPPTPSSTTISPDRGEEADEDKAILQILFPLNLGSIFAVIQVWTSDGDSLSSYDIILIYFIVCSAAAASFFSRVAHRLLRNPPVARKWLFKAAITFTCWDIIGWTCILLPGVAKLVVAALLCFLIIFFAIWSPEPEVSDSSIDNV